tara:strand:- start:121 stop:462 length:342 start_codon:yes stop_codon:yes gene_type:complete
MALKTLEEFEAEAQAEIDAIKTANGGDGKFIQTSNDDKREYNDAEYQQNVTDIANQRFDEQNNGYIRARQEAHDTIGNQLDQLWWDIHNEKLDKTGEWYKAVKKVKDDNPKPS